MFYYKNTDMRITFLSLVLITASLAEPIHSTGSQDATKSSKLLKQDFKENIESDITGQASALRQILKRQPAEVHEEETVQGQERPQQQSPEIQFPHQPPQGVSLLFLHSTNPIRGELRFHTSYSLTFDRQVLMDIEQSRPIKEELCDRLFNGDFRAHLRAARLSTQGFQCQFIPFEDLRGGLLGLEWKVSLAPPSIRQLGERLIVLHCTGRPWPGFLRRLKINMRGKSGGTGMAGRACLSRSLGLRTLG